MIVVADAEINFTIIFMTWSEWDDDIPSQECFHTDKSCNFFRFHASPQNGQLSIVLMWHFSQPNEMCAQITETSAPAACVHGLCVKSLDRADYLCSFSHAHTYHNTNMLTHECVVFLALAEYSINLNNVNFCLEMWKNVSWNIWPKLNDMFYFSLTFPVSISKFSIRIC